ncbi:MAG TPA: N-acetylmuramic acid 6-phosphate etherase [Bacteroidia bacterium]|nr:N-acetylmuramic acid 6-phosphate etherase [Bacteroidia bacterium]HNT79468.1 N-acetylmuramic acid 6-phosphate etherase [Bacteroidia bacterium]
MNSDFTKTTESDSRFNDLEKMTFKEILESINSEDQTIPQIIHSLIPFIGNCANAIFEKMNSGGRLFYIGAGTSGRLGIVDASECPPTFGIEHGRVIGIIAGGDAAIRKAVEFAEDDFDGGWNDLKSHKINKGDFVLGIAASGSTPYVVGALKNCQQNFISTGCIVCNANSPLAVFADYPIEAVVGPEFVTGSTRMKSGTAQKLILNMISTSVMIKLGRVKGNKMVDMQLSNNKLVERGVYMLMNTLEIDRTSAERLLQEHGNVRLAIDSFKK